MNTKADIDAVLASKTIAVVGLSRDPASIGRAAYKKLKAAGYALRAVNPNAAEIDGEAAYPNLAALPEKPDALIFFTKPEQTLAVLREAAERGVGRVWIQQGAESPAVLDFCRERNLTAVAKQCIMMYAPPVDSIHAFHRGVKKFFGGLPR